MGRDGDAALPVDLVDLRADRQRRVNRFFDADGDDVMRDLRQLLADHHRRTADPLGGR